MLQGVGECHGAVQALEIIAEIWSESQPGPGICCRGSALLTALPFSTPSTVCDLVPPSSPSLDLQPSNTLPPAQILRKPPLISFHQPYPCQEHKGKGGQHSKASGERVDDERKALWGMDARW